MPYSIMLDAGHGGERDPGAVYQGRQEKDDNLRLVLALGNALQERGIDVQYTRTTDVYESPSQKAREANEAGVNLFISIHRNSFPIEGGAFGVESLVYDLSGLKYEIAESIDQQLETVGFRDLGVKARPNLTVLRRTNMPAVLVEVGFLNSVIDNEIFDNNFEDIVLAITEGILDVLEENGLIHEMIEPSGYRVQVGAFRNRTYAERFLEELVEQDYPAYIEEADGFYRVMIGDYGELEQAVRMEQRLKRNGYQTLLRRP